MHELQNEKWIFNPFNIQSLTKIKFKKFSGWISENNKHHSIKGNSQYCGQCYEEDNFQQVTPVKLCFFFV